MAHLHQKLKQVKSDINGISSHRTEQDDIKNAFESIVYLLGEIIDEIEYMKTVDYSVND